MGYDVALVCADRGIRPGSSKGAAQHLRGIASGLQDLGHRVRLFSAGAGGGRFPVPVNPLDTLSDTSVDGNAVVYERYSLGHVGGLEFARRNGLRFVLEVNAPLVDEANEHRPGSVSWEDRAIESRLVAEADLVIVVSTALAEWARRFRDKATVVLANGFEPEWFGEAMTRVDRPIHHELVFLGHPKPWHGADRLPGLLVDLAERGHRARLLVVGGGAGTSLLMERAREAGVEGRVTVTGPLPPDQASGLLANTAIGVAPYPARQPFYFCPLKVVDYMAAGLPVVGSRIGDIPDLVGDAGLLVDPTDDAALAAAVAELLDNRERRLELGALGRVRAFETMTWNAVAQQTVAAIDSLPFLAGDGRLAVTS